MKKHLALFVTFAAILVARHTTFAADPAQPAPGPTAEDKAFSALTASLRPNPKERPPSNAPKEDIEKYYTAFFQKGIAEANKFLAEFPDSVHKLEVKYIIGALYAQLHRLGDKEARPKSIAAANEVLDAKINNEVAFQAHLLLLNLVENAADAADRINAIASAFPDREEIPDLWAYLASIHTMEGDTDAARKVCAMIMEKYPKSNAAGRAKAILRKLEIVGKPLELSFTALDGKKVDIADYKGKVVLVDFWATWCGPCVAELPNVLKAYEKFHDKGFEIIGVSLDQSKQRLEAFIADKKMTWPQHFDGKGWDNEISKKFGIDSIPATFLVDKEGKVARLDLRGDALQKAVEELLSK
jgi:thiol-disulfide isomerase/thioredoxin